MTENEWLAEEFEGNRARLRAMAYRMLGSTGEADDAVQEAWLRLSRAGGDGVDNLGGWLTTVVARVCLDMLRSRESRREDPLDANRGVAHVVEVLDPEQEAMLGDSVGLAMLVVLDTLSPPERLAFVDGAPALVWSHGGKPRAVFAFTLDGDRVSAIDLVMEPERLARFAIEHV